MNSDGIAAPTRRHGRLVVVLLALSVALTTLQAAPAEAATYTNVAGATAQCGVGFGAPRRTDAARARALMAGQVDLGKYGRFHLARNPSWRPVSTLDSSGNGHMHSLHYLLPLLRRGVRTGDAAMTNRFYAVLKDWVRDNPPGGRTRRYAWGPPIYEGFRALVLVCAAAGPHGRQGWLLKALALHGRQMANPRRYEGVNNASLHQAMGLYAIAITLGRPAWRKLAVRRMRALAVRLIRTDGSDEEGALEYAINNYRWFGEAEKRLQRAGHSIPAELHRLERIPAFIAHATRPDGRIEALGDTSPGLLSPGTWAGTAAEFGATGGLTGTPPSDTFTAYGGGYVFGRSGWGTARPLTDETFFSVRAGVARGVPHAHDDAGSLTLYAHGAPLLLDTGQWRYQYGTTRSFIASRAAHNVVVVDGVKRSRPGRPRLTTATVDGIDLVTVVDRGYAGVTITRTVAYDRADDVILVWDRLVATRQVRASQQWGLGRDRLVTQDLDAVHTSGPGANVSMLFTSGGAPLDLVAGRRKPLRGWNSQRYGELAPAPSVRATQTGRSLSWLTVIAPRAADVPASTVTGASTVSGITASVLLSTAAGAASVVLSGRQATRSAGVPLVPSARVAAGTVLVGAQNSMQLTGLPPGQPVDLEARVPGDDDWQTVAQSTASAAGTGRFDFTVPATADYRVVSGDAVSVPTRVVAAVAPAPPVDVTATPSGPGQLTVSWGPPPSDGGSPLTRYVVEVNGVRTVAPPTATSLVVSGVVAGPRAVSVRAANLVATSAPTATTVDVPAYPSVAAPAAVRKGSTVTLRARGLVPGAPASVLVTPAKGAPVTRALTVGPAGTAALRLVVKASVTVAVTSGELTSAPRAVRTR